MSNELAQTPITDLSTLGDFQKQTSNDLAAISTSATFLPRLQLMTANSDVVKKGQFEMNAYALIKGDIHVNVGKELQVIPFCWRSKAIDMSGDVVEAFYDIQHAKFVDIRRRADVPNSMCMFGPEFLVWVPSHKSFALFFLGTKSNKRDNSTFLNDNLKKVVTLSSKVIETAKYTWTAVKCVPSNQVVELPNMEALQEEVGRFNNPPEQQIETVDASSNTRER